MRVLDLDRDETDMMVEEEFVGYIEEVDDVGIRVSVSTLDDYGTFDGVADAWIPWDRIVPDERRYAAVGASIHVVVGRVTTVQGERREHRIQLSRPRIDAAPSLSLTEAEFVADPSAAIRHARAGSSVVVTNAKGDARAYILCQNEPLDD